MTKTVKRLYVLLLSKKVKYTIIGKNPLMLERYRGPYRYLITFIDHIRPPKAMRYTRKEKF
jgi:hypothetical protein